MLTVGDKFPEFVHHAWRKDHDDLRDLDIEGEDGFAKRAVFIVDQNNEIQFCNWTKGENTLDPVALLVGV